MDLTRVIVVYYSIERIDGTKVFKYRYFYPHNLHYDVFDPTMIGLEIISYQYFGDPFDNYLFK